MLRNLTRPVVSGMMRHPLSAGPASYQQRSIKRVRSVQRLTFTPWHVLSSLLVALALCTAASAADESEGLVLEQPGGMAGVGMYAVDYWGLVRSGVSNHTDQTLTPLVEHTLGDHRHIQFTHRIWLPPRSRRTQLTPVKPLSPPRNERSFTLASRLIDDSGGRERAAPPSEGLLMSARGTYHTGVMGDRDDNSTSSAVAALRVVAGHQPRAAHLSDEAGPALPAAWNVLDSLLLARTPDFSPAQVDAMRRWILAGGRLWIMLDKVDPAFAQRLLGDAWQVAVVDRVRLETVRIESADGTSTTTEHDYGVELVRTHMAGMEITHQVAGYPAAAWRQVGEGAVLVTTLHASAWLSDRSDEGTPTTEAADEAEQAGAAAARLSVVANESLQELAWFLQPADDAGPEEQVVREALAGQARAQIGYTIIGRAPVLAVLALFAMALLASGAVLARRNRLEWVGVVGVALALLASGVLVGMGKLRQSEHPMTLANADLVHPASEQPYASVTGVVSVFRPEHAPGSVTFAGSGQTIVFPNDLRRSSERTRMVWHGLDRWEFPHLNLPAGAARTFYVDHVIDLDQPMSVDARLTEQGLGGQVHGLAGRSLDDALIALPSGRMVARVTGEGVFEVAVDDRLIGDQYVRATSALGTLSQTQMNRQAAYRQLLAQPGFPAEPTLLAWAEAGDRDMEMSHDAVRRSQRLVMVPLRLQRPEPGQRVTVPAPMMAMDGFRGEGGSTGMSIYDRDNREWVAPITQPMTMFMRYEPPTAWRAIEVDSAILELHLNAPGWRFEVVRYGEGGRAEPVYEGRNPTGRMSIELGPDQAPAMRESGGVIVGLRLSPLDGADVGRGWSLHRMDLSVQGVAR